MATANLGVSRRQDWILANPWLFAGGGFVFCLLALGTTRLLGPDPDFLRGIFFVLGLAASGSAVVLRLNSTRPAYLDDLGENVRQLVLRVLAGIFGLASLGLTVAVLLRLLGNDFIPFNPGSLLVAWVVIGPICFFACHTCLRPRDTDQFFPWAHEAALLLVLVGINCVLASWSLYLGPRYPLDWVTMRLFLSVVAFAAFIAAPFLLVSQPVRRLGLSALFLIHFGGICTAALGQPPSPWLIGQLWVRIYRPYLEFMYLNNAYHFYAPEPDASSYLWFRLNYEDPQGKTHGVWYKIPDLDDDGWHRHTVALEYQRYLSLTENIAQGSGPSGILFDWTTSPLAKNNDEDWIATYYMTNAMKKRWRRSDTAVLFKMLKKKLDAEGKQKEEVVIGERDPVKLPVKLDLPKALNPMDYPDVYPFYPSVALDKQYAPPNSYVQRFLESYVRHVARRPHPEHPEWGIKSVKVYKVKHVIIPEQTLLNQIDPQDPLFYHPYYMGEYDPDGQILDVTDPLLHWMLPIMRRDFNPQKSLRADFARRHAGDENWVTYVVEGEPRRWIPAQRKMFD